MRGTSANDSVVVDPRWRGEIEWADVLPNRPGMFAVRTRGNHVRAGEIEVRSNDGLVCWVDGRWRSVEDLRPGYEREQGEAKRNADWAWLTR